MIELVVGDLGEKLSYIEPRDTSWVSNRGGE